MLPRPHRLTTSSDFAATVRRGQRAGTPNLVVHLHVGGQDQPPQVGLIVSRAVGGAVVRNRVKRRLRHIVSDRMERLPAGSCLVVRALSGASEAQSARLGADIDRALDRVLSRAQAAGVAR